MHKILEDYDNRVAEINKRTKRQIRNVFICGGIFIVFVVYFGFFYTFE